MTTENDGQYFYICDVTEVDVLTDKTSEITALVCCWPDLTEGESTKMLTEDKARSILFRAMMGYGKLNYIRLVTADDYFAARATCDIEFDHGGEEEKIFLPPLEDSYEDDDDDDDLSYFDDEDYYDLEDDDDNIDNF